MNQFIILIHIMVQSTRTIQIVMHINENVINVIRNDANVVGLNFTEYQEGMTGGRRVALVAKTD